MEKRLLLTPSRNIRYPPKVQSNDGTPHVTWEMLNDAYINRTVMQRATNVQMFEQHDSRVTASRSAKPLSGCSATLITNAVEM